MNVENGLTGCRVAIHDRTIARFRNALGCCDLTGCGIQAPDKSLIRLFDVVERCDMFAWYDQHMRWSLRVDIAKRHSRIGLVNNIGRDVAGNDFAEQAIRI